MSQNGGKIACKGKYHNIKLSIGDYKMQSNMYFHPLAGCDIILGV